MIRMPAICSLSLICMMFIALHCHHYTYPNWKDSIRENKLTVSESGHRHLLIMMGKGEDLRAWMKIILESSNLNHVALVLGVFDEDVTALECSSDDNPKRRVSCVSVAGTTWTTGRNKLVETAFALEEEQNLTYSFWTLADADILLYCHHAYLFATTINPSECFSQYDTFLSELPENATAATLISKEAWPIVPNAAMIHMHSMNAAWNSFRHSTVQILFPYQPDLDAITWWSSQAIFWYRIQCLAPLYVVTPLYVFFINTKHADYPRNPRNYTEEHRIGTNMIGKLSAVLERAPTSHSLEYKQEKIRPLPLMQEPMDDVFYLCLKEFSGKLVN